MYEGGMSEINAALCFKSQSEGTAQNIWTDAEQVVEWINVP
jgi:hypothetical protein